MAGRLALANRNDVRWWLLGGTFALGLGVWSMHLVGMLAFSLPVAIGYDPPLTALSLAASLAASGYALCPGHAGHRHHCGSDGHCPACGGA